VITAKTAKWLIGVIITIGLVMAISSAIGCIVLVDRFERQCEDHLRIATHTNSIETAIVEVDAAISYVEANHLTDGSTDVFLKTPSHDLSFWYQNLKTARQSLLAVPKTATEMEKSNVLLKLKETLSLVPSGISLYPHTLFWALTPLLGLALVTLGLILNLMRL
jgi:hypothetical protein